MYSVSNSEDAAQSDNSEEGEMEGAWNLLVGELEEEDLIRIGFESDIDYRNKEPESESGESEDEGSNNEHSDVEMEYTEL